MTTERELQEWRWKRAGRQRHRQNPQKSTYRGKSNSRRTTRKANNGIDNLHIVLIAAIAMFAVLLAAQTYHESEQTLPIEKIFKR